MVIIISTHRASRNSTSSQIRHSELKNRSVIKKTKKALNATKSQHLYLFLFIFLHDTHQNLIHLHHLYICSLSNRKIFFLFISIASEPRTVSGKSKVSINTFGRNEWMIIVSSISSLDFFFYLFTTSQNEAMVQIRGKHEWPIDLYIVFISPTTITKNFFRTHDIPGI